MKAATKFNRLIAFFPVGAPSCSWAANAKQAPDVFADEKTRADGKRKTRNEAARKRRAGGGLENQGWREVRGKKGKTPKTATKKASRKTARSASLEER